MASLVLWRPLLSLLAFLSWFGRKHVGVGVYHPARRRLSWQEQKLKFLDTVPPKVFPPSVGVIAMIGVGLLAWAGRLLIAPTVRLVQWMRVRAAVPLSLPNLPSLRRCAQKRPPVVMHGVYRLLRFNVRGPLVAHLLRVRLVLGLKPHLPLS